MGLAALFVAGGRERQALWHFDPAAGSIAAADDEARWLSDDEPADQPLGAGSADGSRRCGQAMASSRDRCTTSRLTAVWAPSLGAASTRCADGARCGAGTARGAEGGRAGGATGSSGGEDQRGAESPLDLVSAMRSRRRSRETAPRTGGRRRGPDGHPGQVASTGSQPSDVPNGSTHPAGRRRPPEPLELDPSLMDDPPAAHPRSSSGVAEITVDDAALSAEPAVMTAAAST
jgi:hypothetical protein